MEIGKILIDHFTNTSFRVSWESIRKRINPKICGSLAYMAGISRAYWGVK